MPRRVIPAADDLFRPTVVPDPPAGAPEAAPASTVEPPAKPAKKKSSARTASGRVKHDEKMTVYVTSDELFDIEHARLELRRTHGVAVDRGRLVRAAVALALADLDAHGAESALVRRLGEA